jgi:hypothetical protein
MTNITTRLLSMAEAMWMDRGHDELDALLLEAKEEIERLREALDTARETNRRINRRAQVSEAVSQSAFDLLNGWYLYLCNHANHRPRPERHLLLWIIRDAKERVRKLAARAALVPQQKGNADGK